MGLTISSSSALSMSMLLLLDMHDLNEVLFLKVRFLFLLLASSVPSTVIVPFTTIYVSL